ncbi:protein ZBED8-like [Limulus polyphemus]|uniref:Protein ZBED8-like n=1 Tax=Limulus polyphemus TaxID=6850 RepID=A0ABM1B6L9_LIMPO|nr:protein ZBED8-like [Limulus polyphemus]
MITIEDRPTKVNQLIALVRYVKNEEVLEHILFCEPLKTTTKDQNVFALIKEFFLKDGLDMNIVGSICTDGAPAMLGNQSRFAALIKREIPEVRVTHYLLHRYALAAKSLPKSLQDVLSTCVKIVNVIGGRSLNHRLFQAFCKSMDSEHTVLLYHTDVKWLSRGRVLQRIFELREEIKTFLKDQKKFGSQRPLNKEPDSVSVKPEVMPDEYPFKEGIIDMQNDHASKMEFEVKKIFGHHK